MRKLFLVFAVGIFCAASFLLKEAAASSRDKTVYRYQETKALVSLVNDAASLIEQKGEAAFPEFKKEKSKWRHGNTYIFVIAPNGDMILHPDPVLEGKPEIQLKDVNGKPIIQGLIGAASGADKHGWCHYQWPEPGSMFPRWKSSFVMHVVAPSGKKYVVGSGLYNMKMEKDFIVTAVDAAVALIDKEGEAAFAKLRDKSGPFIFMDIYVFVDSPDGVELVNPAFPSIEGRNLLEYKDSSGKYLVRDYINVALTKDAGWTNYFWPKPNEAAPSKKHTYVKKATYGNKIFIVGSGTYLEE